MEPDWLYHVELVRGYAARTGSANVPYRYVHTDGTELGRWVALQRSLHRQGRLDAQQAGVLSRLPGWAWQAPRPSRAVNVERDAEIVALRDQGWSLAQIGDKFMLSRQRVHQVLQAVSR